MNIRGKTIWFFGLSGSGKSTLASILEKYLNSNKNNIDIEVLDGDNVREGLTRDLGFSLEDRFEHIRRVCFVADLLSKHGVCVIASFITPLEAMRIYLRQKLGNRLILVYCDSTIEKCIERDVKGLYQKALNGEIKQMTGLTQTFEYPQTIGRMYDDMRYIRMQTEFRDVDSCLDDLLKVLESWDMKKT